MTYPRKVQVLRIPASGSPFELVTVNTVTYDNSDFLTIDAQTIDLEARLGHVPDLRQFHHRTTNLKYLCLFDKDLSFGAVRERWQGEYYIYKCLNGAEAKLRGNRHLKRYEKERNYGDAFIFRVRYVEEFGGHWMAVYGDMEDFARSLRHEGSAGHKLETMATW